MNEITNWMQNNWYELGSLTAQFAFLFAGLWFAVKILKTMRATQQQMGALLRLSMTDGLEERSKMNDMAHEINDAAQQPAPSVVAGSMFSPAMERPASHNGFEKPARTERPSLSSELNARTKASAPFSSAPVISEPTSGASMTSTQDETPYVAAPLTLPEEENGGGHLTAAVQWLQTPMANKRKSANPLKKVVRWLQEPAR